jgi:hypothetical protein
MDSIPAELLELQNRFETWRASRQHLCASIPDELRSATLEMSRRYPPSLIKRVLKVDPARLKRALSAKRSAPTAAPKKKPRLSRPVPPGGPRQKSKSAAQTQAATLSQPAFFKLPTVAALPVDSSFTDTPTPCRVQLERPDGSRLTLTWPGLTPSLISSLVADFWSAGNR